MAGGTLEPRLIEVRCPADGRLVGTVPVADRSEVAAVAAELRSAQPSWEELGPAGRGRYLQSWLDWFFDNDRRIGELVQQETGKAWADASMETAVVIELINFYTKHAAKFLAPRHIAGHGLMGLSKRLRVTYRPYPLIGLITPWNGPVAGPILDLVGALMAGAAVLTKPSEVTPLSWKEAVRGWTQDVGAPHVLGCVTGDSATGEAVVDEVDLVMFTGSTRTGRKIAARAGERLIPCCLELGGKDAMIVLADADIDRAAAAATWGAMFNAGQGCVAVERVYVEGPAYAGFVENVTQRVKALRVGFDKPGEFGVDLGAITTGQQIEIIERHVQDAALKGARILTGGNRHGQFFEPTVLVDVDHTMLCMQAETFGPIIPIMKVEDEREAVRLANDSRFGLSASVWTRNPARAERLAGEIQAGSVNVNNVLVNLFQLNLPMGGWKQSGIGTRLGGAIGIQKYCRPQAQLYERFTPEREPHWFPVSRRKGTIQSRVHRFLGAHDWRRRLGLGRSPGTDCECTGRDLGA